MTEGRSGRRPRGSKGRTYGHRTWGSCARVAVQHQKRRHRRPSGRRWQGGSMTASATIALAPQHLQALHRANQVRLARADLKRRVAEGRVSASEIVLECPAEVEGMAVSDLLMSQRRWGRTRCRKFLATIPLSESKQIGKLTDRQRRAVAAELPTSTPSSSNALERPAHRAPALAGAAV